VSRLAFIGVAALLLGCVSGEETSDAATQGSLGGPCFANNTCNANLTCVLVNGKGVCEQSDATTTSETGSDATQDQTTQDVTGDVAPADAGCEASVTAQPACLGNCGLSGDLCCPISGQCFQSGCVGNCNGSPCWLCSSKSDCPGNFCCAPNAAIQGACPPTATVDVNDSTFCASTCPNVLYLCVTSNDCPSTAPTCVPATATGLAHSTIGVCQ
jgi:hypothetical protein